MNRAQNSKAFAIVAKMEGEVYCIIYKRSRADEALRTLGRWASDKDLSLTWAQAGTMAKRIQHQLSETNA